MLLTTLDNIKYVETIRVMMKSLLAFSKFQYFWKLKVGKIFYYEIEQRILTEQFSSSLSKSIAEISQNKIC